MTRQVFVLHFCAHTWLMIFFFFYFETGKSLKEVVEYYYSGKKTQKYNINTRWLSYRPLFTFLEKGAFGRFHRFLKFEK